MARTAMVTGASGGIGLEFAEQLAKQGYQVTLVARGEAKLKEHVARFGAGHRFIAADLSVSADTKRVAEDVRTTKYDLLVNNAGVGVYGPFAETPVNSTVAMMRLNMESLVELAHAFLHGAKKGDALINVSSTLAFLSFPGATTYCATKAFVTAFSEGLWYENKARGVYVAGLHPGATKTNFHEAAGGANDNRPPEGITQAVGPVVEAALQALQSRSSPNILTSFANKAMVFFSTRMIPRKAMVNMMGGQSPVKAQAQLKT